MSSIQTVGSEVTHLLKKGLSPDKVREMLKAQRKAESAAATAARNVDDISFNAKALKAAEDSYYI